MIKEKRKISHLNFQFKMIIAIRSDLKLTKAAVYASHVAVLAVEDAKKRKSQYLKKWFSEGQKKVAVKAPSEQILQELYQKAKSENLPCAIINSKDSTNNVNESYVAIAIGPVPIIISSESKVSSPIC